MKSYSVNKKNLVGYWTLNEDDLTEGEDIVSGWDLSSWSKDSGVSTPDSDTFISTGAGGVYTTKTVTVGKTYKLVVYGDISANAFEVRYIGGGAAIQSGFGETSFEATRTDMIYLKNTGAATTNIDILKLVEIDSAIKDKSGNDNNGAITRTDLVSDGVFATDTASSTVGTYWTTGSGTEITGGKAVFDGSQTGNGLIQDIGMTIGHTYRITYTITNYTSDIVVIYVGGTSMGTGRNSAGTYVEDKVCSGSSSLYFYSNNFGSNLNELQNRLVKNKAESLGFKNKCEFIRTAVLNDNLSMEQMINKIHKVPIPCCHIISRIRSKTNHTS